MRRELFRKWRARGTPVRCFWIPSDYLAFGVIEEMDERGLRLGQDFSILSYDNFEGAGYAPWRKPRLSSFEPPLAEIGKKAATLLAEEATGIETECQMFQPHLVDRGSVADFTGMRNKERSRRDSCQIDCIKCCSGY